MLVCQSRQANEVTCVEAKAPKEPGPVTIYQWAISYDVKTTSPKNDGWKDNQIKVIEADEVHARRSYESWRKNTNYRNVRLLRRPVSEWEQVAGPRRRKSKS